MMLDHSYHLIYRRLMQRFAWATIQRHEHRIWEAVHSTVRRRRREVGLEKTGRAR